MLSLVKLALLAKSVCHNGRHRLNLCPEFQESNIARGNWFFPKLFGIVRWLRWLRIIIVLRFHHLITSLSLGFRARPSPLYSEKQYLVFAFEKESAFQGVLGSSCFACSKAKESGDERT